MENLITDNKLKAMISLLDDADNEVVAHVTNELLSYGNQIIPQLEHVWEDLHDMELQERIENIIHLIQFNQTKADLQTWLDNPKQDLLEAMIVISKYQYPDLSENRIRNHIESIRIDAWMEMNYYLTALEKIRILNHIFFRLHGFSGNTEHYNAADNSFINKVLETKKGNPVSLCVLYMIIAQRLQIPIYGVNLPQHFILTYLDDAELASELPVAKRDPLFYINAFNKGMVFGRKEIDQFLQLIKMEADDRYYHACSVTEIVIRIFNNLITAFQEQNKQDKVTEVQQLRDMVSAHLGSQQGEAE